MELSGQAKTKKIKSWSTFRFTNLDLTKTTGMEILKGRDFSKDFVDTANVLVNEAMVKVMGMKDPVGKMIDWDQPIRIIGVVKDYVMESPYQKAKPLLIAQNPNRATTIL